MGGRYGIPARPRAIAPSTAVHFTQNKLTLLHKPIAPVTGELGVSARGSIQGLSKER
jgi:hypothetical protein